MSRKSTRSSRKRKRKSSKSERSASRKALPTSPSSLSGFSPTVATIDLSALAHNVEQIRRAVPTCEILAVVKADAYGHGALTITQALGRLGITRFAVATLQEGMALRDGGVRAAILVMGALVPEQLPDLIGYRLTPVLSEAATARQLIDLLRTKTRPYPVHIKVDTGMGRLGLLPDAALDLLQSPALKGSLRAEGLMTHLADADAEEASYTHAQIERFQQLVDRTKSVGLSIPLLHAANSAAILCHPVARFTAVRPGIMLYGYHTAKRPSHVTLKPVLSFSTQVAQVRTMAAGESVSYNQSYVTPSRRRIAVLPVGYADGYSRTFSNRGWVLIHGSKAPIVGRVCMDMTMVDVTDILDVKPGDQAVLIGRQGSNEISAMDLARWQDTIPYEILCGIGHRVRRIYHPAERRSGTDREA
jgi:alanine racemase